MNEHEILPEGESRAKWAINVEPGFIGSIKQLLHCARCGQHLGGGPNKPHKVFDMFKPTMHRVCDECFEELPE